MTGMCGLEVLVALRDMEYFDRYITQIASNNSLVMFINIAIFCLGKFVKTSIVHMNLWGCLVSFVAHLHSIGYMTQKKYILLD